MLLQLTVLTATLLMPVVSGHSAKDLGDEPRDIAWYSGSFDAATREATKEKKPLLVYFWMDGSQHCTALYQNTLQTPEAAQALRDFIVISAKATDPSGAKLVQRFGVRTLPTLLFIRPDGVPDEAVLGNLSVSTFVSEVQRIRQGTNTVSDLRRQASLAPDDLALRFRLADKLQYVGGAAEAQRLIDSIKTDDPKGQTVIGAQLHLYDVMNDITAGAKDVNDPSTYDLKPMYSHMSKVKPDPVRFEGWQWVANVERQRGKRDEQRKALMEGWPHTPQGQQMDWGRELVGNFWDMRDELTKKEKMFALKVAEMASARALELLASEEPEPALLGEGFLDNPNAYVADQLDGLACAFYMNGKRRKALETSRRSLELDPGVPEHQAFLDHFEDRKK